MKVDASSAGDMPAFAGFRRSMGEVFCSFLRPLPRNSLGSGRGVAVGFPPSNWDLETRNRPKDQYFPSCPVCARICARRFER